jgi:hypothetical protein
MGNGATRFERVPSVEYGWTNGVFNKGHSEKLLMFRRRESKNSLAVPPIAIENPAAVEVLRVWAAPGSPQQLTLRTTWEDPAAWGLMLVDIARHAAKAYEAEGRMGAEVLKRIRELWDAEWSNPTG